MNTSIFDTEFALSQLSGNMDLLLKLLTKFVAEYKELPSKLDTLYSTGDFKEMKLRVHTVKGVSGNLGMNALHHASKELETCVIEQHDIERNRIHFDSVLGETLDFIEQLDAEHNNKNAQTAPNQNTPVDVEEKNNGIGELTDYLKRNEFIPADKLTQLLANSGLEEAHCAALKELIDDLDYPGALALITENHR